LPAVCSLTRRPTLKPSHLADLVTVSDPRLHPDGERVAFSTSQAEVERDLYRQSIWLWDGNEARPFTSGDQDLAPRWSPTGDRLAFLRQNDRDDQRRQVAVIPADGGEARIVGELPGGFEMLEWSPDGRWLAAIGTDWTEQWAELDPSERERRPRRITRVPYRFDLRGWLHDRRSHLYLIDPTAERDIRCLTPGDFEESDFAWRPDSRGLAFCSARHPSRGLEPGVSVYEVGLDGGEPAEVVGRGLWSHPTYRPDGVLHLMGNPDPWAHPTVMAMWRREADGRMTDLTGYLDRSLVVFSPPPAPDRPQWIEEGFVGVLEDRGRVGVIRADADGKVTSVIEGDRVVTGVSASADGSKMAFVSTSPTDPGELRWWEEGRERTLTSLNEGFRERAGLITPEPFTFAGDGDEIDGWVYLPPGDAPVPLLLNIHGGPASQYGFRFFDEFQVYAAAGFGVVACNPHGSTGRGRDFVRGVVGERWGVTDLADVTACVAAALDRFTRLDADRMGVMGGSYGGFLTAWLIAHDSRFESAIVERALLGWESFAGTSDIGATFPRSYLGVDLPAGRAVLAAKSPLSVAHRITTPTLILHSENDFRCPMEQAEQLFMILLKAGTEAELVRFPGEGHELSRSGKPRHRLERFEIVLDWHRRHLIGDDVGR
jgi:dipeptidyl aminopeptidase/acylaminoacyl peptidase